MKALINLALMCLLPLAGTAADFKMVDYRHADNPFVVFRVIGSIAYPLNMEFQEHFAKIPKDVRVFIHLDSPGGSLEEGTKIIGSIRLEIAAGREVNSLIRNGERCASMCVPIFLQGQERRAGEISSFMFHGVTKPLSNVPDVAKTKLHLKMFEDAGVDQAFLDRLWEKKVFEQPGAYWMTGRELYEQKTGIVNRISSHHEVYEPVYPPYDPQIRPRGRSPRVLSESTSLSKFTENIRLRGLGGELVPQTISSANSYEDLSQ